MYICIYKYIYITPPPLSISRAFPLPSPPSADASSPYMLNTQNEETNTVFFSYLACCMNTLPMNMYEFLSYTGFTSGIWYSYACGCVAGICEYVFNT